MTIGPEPITRMCEISVRLGISPDPPALQILLRLAGPVTARAGRSSSRSFEQLDEAVEQVGRIVRAGRSLGVVLHAERLDVARPQALDDIVVEADVADLDLAEVRARRAVERGV